MWVPVTPDTAVLFEETRTIMLRQHQLFLTGGTDSLTERLAIRDRLEAIKVEMEENFPWNDAEVLAFHEALAEQFLAIHDIERDAVLTLQTVLAHPPSR